MCLNACFLLDIKWMPFFHSRPGFWLPMGRRHDSETHNKRVLFYERIKLCVLFCFVFQIEHTTLCGCQDRPGRPWVRRFLWKWEACKKWDWWHKGERAHGQGIFYVPSHYSTPVALRFLTVPFFFKFRLQTELNTRGWKKRQVTCSDCVTRCPWRWWALVCEPSRPLWSSIHFFQLLSERPHCWCFWHIRWKGLRSRKGRLLRFSGMAAVLLRGWYEVSSGPQWQNYVVQGEVEEIPVF